MRHGNWPRLTAALMLVATPALAQQSNDSAARLDRIEKELKAVQRKVFPAGSGKYFEPEFKTGGSDAATPPAPAADNGALVALQRRVDSLEAQLRETNGQLEEATFKLRQLDAMLTRLKGDAEFRLNALEGGQPASPAATAAASATPAASAATPPSPPPAAAATKAKDPAEAAYLAAYAYVDAKDYPNAERALAAFAKENPKSRRASYAQYWLGRVYAAQEKKDEAALAFAEGYEKFPKGERAPETLLWLGKSLTARKQTDLACRSFNELDAAFKDVAKGRLAKELKTARADAKCS